MKSFDLAEGGTLHVRSVNDTYLTLGFHLVTEHTAHRLTWRDTRTLITALQDAVYEHDQSRRAPAEYTVSTELINEAEAGYDLTRFTIRRRVP